MKRIATLLALAMAAASLLAGCGQSTSPPAPTSAPSVPAKAAEPTKPVAATAAPTKAPQPTTAPTAAPTAAPKVDFPTKGKAITLIVPWAAGGPVDIGARVVAPALEKELGVPVQIVNKDGASSQVGLTELARSRPDGYTLAVTSQSTTAMTYLDPDAKAVYARKDFQPIAMMFFDPYVVGVKSDSPFKGLKDVVDAARAKPEGVKVATSGVMATSNFVPLMLEEQTGVKFARVNFTGGGPAATAVLGGHVDLAFLNGSAFTAPYKSGDIRLIALLDQEETKLYPGIKTAESQGYKLNAGSTTGLAGPAGMPRDVLDVLSAAARRAMDQPEFQRKMDELSRGRRFMDPVQYAAHWDQQEEEAKRMIPLARK